MSELDEVKVENILLRSRVEELERICKTQSDAIEIKDKNLFTLSMTIAENSAELARLREQVRILETPKVDCLWKEDEEGTWTATCGLEWVMDCDSPAENDMTYCPKCGRTIHETRYTPEVE